MLTQVMNAATPHLICDARLLSIINTATRLMIIWRSSWTLWSVSVYAPFELYRDKTNLERPKRHYSY